MGESPSIGEGRYALERPARDGVPERNEPSPRKQVVPGRIERISPVEGASLVGQWGFPRPVSPGEMDCDQWWTYKCRAIWWLEPTVPGVWAPHVALNPAVPRGMVPLIKCWREVVEQAEIAFGEGFLVVVPPFGRIGPYLPRLGFDFSEKLGWWMMEFGEPDG